MKHLLFTLILTLGFASLAQCQEVRFQRLTTEDGLSNGRNWANKCILRDNFGLVWIATVDGLNLWDGYNVKTFRHDPFDTTSITSNFVTSLVQSNDGDIYIGTANKGMVRYDYNKEVFEDMHFEDAIGEDVPQVNHLLYDSLDNIWIGSAFSGIWRYHIPQDSFIYMPISKDSVLDALNRGSLNATMLRNGEIAIASFGGIHVYNYEADSFRHYPVQEQEVFSIAEAENGEIWYGGRYNDGIRILNTEDGSIRKFEEDIPGNVYGLKRDLDGNMWYSNANGYNQVHKYNLMSKRTTTYAHNPNISSSFTPSTIMEIVFDSTAHLWYMTAGVGAGFASTEQPFFEKMTDYPVDNIFFWEEGKLLLPIGMTVEVFDVESKSSSTLISSQKELSYRPSLLTKEGNYIYKQFQEEELYEINRNTGGRTKISTVSNTCEDILDDGLGRLWTSQRLEYINKNSGEIIKPNELLKQKGSALLLPKSIYYDVELLSSEEIAVASLTDGFFVYNHRDTTLFHYDGKDFERGKLSSSSITYIHKGQSDSLVFIATGNNLNIWNRNTDSFSYINPSDGLEGKILSLYEDKQQNLWVLTSKGIHRIKNGAVLASYGKKYGLMGQVDRIDPIMVADEEGLIYFSTSEGLFRFDPKRLENISAPVDVVITDLYHKRNKVTIDKDNLLSQSMLYNPTLAFKYKNRDIGFGFVAPFESESELEYYYRLIGYDTTWINNKDSREVHFTNLDNGNYTFEVKAKSAEGNWTKNISTKDFTILPPWYKKWWAYLLFALLVGSILYCLYRYRINQILRYEKLRTKISSDLHDDVGTLLSSLAMQSDVLGIDAPPEKVSKYEKFSSLSREAMDRMRDTVWAIDSRKDNMVSLIDRMADYISDMYVDHRIKVVFTHDASKISNSLAPDIRQNVYLIFKEALNNAMKYSNGDKVTVSLIQSSRSITLSVKDNGNVDKANTSGTGISNMKMRARRIKGELNILKNDGYEVRLAIEK